MDKSTEENDVNVQEGVNAQESETIMRLRADMQNMTRSFQLQSLQIRSDAVARILCNLMPFFDCVEIGARTNEAIKVLWDMLSSELDKNAIEVYSPEIGSEFDPHTQAILSVQESDEDAKVISVAQVGYRLKDNGRVIREARVICSKKKQ